LTENEKKCKIFSRGIFMAKKDKKAQENETVTSGISRKFSQNPALYIGSVVILVLVVVTFVGGDLLSGGGFGIGGGDLTFGSYDRVPISWVPGNTFSRNVEEIEHQARSQGFDPNEPWVLSQIWRYAYEKTLINTAVLQIMKRSNYLVPQKTLDRFVAQYFMENGRFSRAAYNQVSDSHRNRLLQQTREELTMQMFFDDLRNILLPSAEADFIASMAGPVRRFDVVSFQIDDYPLEGYLEFAQETPDLFKTVHLSRISFDREREAKKILDSIKNGTNLFEDIARSQSVDAYAERGGDMGPRYFFELEQEIPELSDRYTVSSLSAGELSDVIKTRDLIRNKDVWTIFRAEEEPADADFDDENVMEIVQSYTINFQTGRLYNWATGQAENFIEDAKESGFDNAARRRNLEKQSFGPLPINHGGFDFFTKLDSFPVPGISSFELSNLANNENFWKLAFSTELNTPSEPFTQGNNVFVFFPTEQSDADESTISNIASMYSSHWLNNNIDQYLQTYFLNHARMKDNFDITYSRIFRH